MKQPVQYFRYHSLDAFLSGEWVQYHYPGFSVEFMKNQLLCEYENELILAEKMRENRYLRPPEKRGVLAYQVTARLIQALSPLLYPGPGGTYNDMSDELIEFYIKYRIAFPLEVNLKKAASKCWMMNFGYRQWSNIYNSPKTKENSPILRRAGILWDCCDAYHEALTMYRLFNKLRKEKFNEKTRN